MGRQPLIHWAPRVQPPKVRRLYELEKSGIYDDELLMEVGWGLHARCKDALAVWRAVCEGELPCPQCGEPVRRRSRKSWVGDARPPADAEGFACPACGERLTWRECRDALRKSPKCFDCLAVLTWRYAENLLRCDRCGTEWPWQRYRRSITARTWLPCPCCSERIRRPTRTSEHGGEGESPDGPGRAECPECGALGVHGNGMFCCGRCGHETTWSKYRRRMGRRLERLHCPSCGSRFTWQSWRASYLEQNLFTGGGTEPLREFASEWAKCKTPQRQMILIDGLLHAVHGQGALGPLLIEGDERAVMQLLDELAQPR